MRTVSQISAVSFLFTCTTRFPSLSLPNVTCAARSAYADAAGPSAAAYGLSVASSEFGFLKRAYQFFALRKSNVFPEEGSEMSAEGISVIVIEAVFSPAFTSNVSVTPAYVLPAYERRRYSDVFLPARTSGEVHASVESASFGITETAVFPETESSPPNS